MEDLSRKAIAILAIMFGILIIFPTVQAEEILKPDVLWVPAYHYTTSDRPSTFDIRYVIIHDLEGYYDYNVKNWQTAKSTSSIHYVISKKGEITQMVKDKDIAWQAGNGLYNKQTIGIEMEGFADKCQYTEEEYVASARLVKWLAKEYDIPLTHLDGIAPADPMNNEGIIGHYQVPSETDPTKGGGNGGHYDPGKCWDWDHYMQLLTGVRIYDGVIAPVITSPGSEATLIYSIENSDPYLIDYTILAAQIKKSGSKDAWIDISGTSISDNKIINLIPGIHDYTRKFKIPATVTAGKYDVRWYVIDSRNEKAIAVRVDGKILEVKSISELPKPTITVISPDSGENWKSGSWQNIAWTTKGNPGGYAKIELLKNGVSVAILSENTVITSDGSYVWNIPSTQAAGEDYQIKVTSSVNSEYTDKSDGYFAIDGQVVAVVAPNGGESWSRGSEQKIQWKFIRKPITPVKIELQKGPSLLLTETIVLSAPTDISGDGSYLWTIPTTKNIGTDYKIVVTSTASPANTDSSNGYFAIDSGVCSAYPMSSSGIKISAISIDPCTPPTPTTPMLDLVILVDTTYSMWDDIDAVKAAASEIVQAIDLEGFDSRVAIADYRDRPEWPYGNPGVDYVYNLNLPFSNDTDSIITAINGLSLGDGVDTSESVYSALVHTMEDTNKDMANSASSGWRNGATKAIIIMGDAPPHIPELWEGGHTLADVISTSESIDPVIVYSVVIGSDQPTYEAFSEISSGTNGKVYTSPTFADIVAAILEAIGDIGQTPENRGVLLNITPALNETTVGNSAGYTVNVTNIGSLNDTYSISLELNNFVGFQRGYPVAIQESWVNFNSA
ncbi:MAG: N-acetylmuramoyl-L-alanine amidase, partial [Planctomycetota bacterium]